jgi:hypothetical protein
MVFWKAFPKCLSQWTAFGRPWIDQQISIVQPLTKRSDTIWISGPAEIDDRHQSRLSWTGHPAPNSENVNREATDPMAERDEGPAVGR